MKLNIAFPETGKVKVLDCDDDKKFIAFLDKRIGSEVPADTIGDEWKGYVLRITGGNDKQGFPMMQGILCNTRVRLLMRPGMPCYRPRRTGAMRRKSVRGCVVGPDISSLNLIIARKGENDIEGLTDEALPRRLGPKRASKIRKLFGLSKSDDVRKFVVRRKINDKCTKAPKIQRLVTAERLARKAAYKKELVSRSEKRQKAAEEFSKIIAAYVAEKNVKA